MTPRRSHGELEQLLLMTVLRLGEAADGAAIRAELEARTGRKVGPGTLYPTLARLEEKGMLRSELGEPTPTRGGRARRLFSVTEDGLDLAREGWRRIVRLAEGLEELLEPGAG